MSDKSIKHQSQQIIKIPGHQRSTKNQIDLFKRYTFPPRKLHIIMLLTLLVPFYYQRKRNGIFILNSINIWAGQGDRTDKSSPNRHISRIKFLLYGVQFYNLNES